MPEEEATAATNPRVGAVADDVFGVEAGEAEAGKHLREWMSLCRAASLL
jgi:hypothetical protein